MNIKLNLCAIMCAALFAATGATAQRAQDPGADMVAAQFLPPELIMMNADAIGLRQSQRLAIVSDVKAIWNGTDFDNQAHVGTKVAVITDRTNFYAESGGQVGDHGRMLTEWDPGQLGTRGYSSTGQTGGAT